MSFDALFPSIVLFICLVLMKEAVGMLWAIAIILFFPMLLLRLCKICK